MSAGDAASRSPPGCSPSRGTPRPTTSAREGGREAWRPAAAGRGDMAGAVTRGIGFRVGRKAFNGRPDRRVLVL